MAITSQNIQALPMLSKAVGSKNSDIQIFNLARDFNKFLNLDSEALIFALLKKGMKANIASIFSMSEKSIRKMVERAIADSIIPDSLDIDFQLYLLNFKINNYIVAEFGDLFVGTGDTAISSISASDKSIIIRKLIEYSYQDKKIDDAFYNELYPASNPPVTSITKDILKRFFDYRDLCYGNNLFLNRFVLNGSLGHLDNLLKLDKDGIEGEITTQVLANNCIPDEIKLAPYPKKAYTDYIYSQIEKRYATRSLLLKLANVSDKSISFFNIDNLPNMFDLFKTMLVDDESDSVADNRELLMDTTIQLLENNQTVIRSFNIEKDIIRDYIAKIDIDSEFIASTIEIPGFTQKDFITIFTVIQRLYYLAKEDKFETILVLLKKNYCSAYDIVKKGRTKFNRDFADLDASKRNYIYNIAEVKVNKALALLNKYSQPSNSLMPSAIKSKSLTDNSGINKIKVVTMPELETLFGNQDVTDTKHCESVLGPAAYLVDLLNLLKQIEVSETPEIVLFDKLDERRPDIALIPLNCQNAVAPLPYIDLAIEILENWIANFNNLSLAIKSQLGWDTKSDADALKADPDYCCYEPYTYVRDNYSWKQPPFDMFNEELKLYTKALNVNRASWAEIVKENFPNTTDYIDPYYDILGFNSRDKNFFSNVELLNLNANLFVKNIVNSIPVTNYTGDTPILPYTKRIKIKDLLENTGLNLFTFKQLLGSYYINPEITLEGDPAKYRYSIHFTQKIELENAYLEFLTTYQANAFIYTMYIFRRLQLATGWSVPLLDAILMEINADIKTSYTYNSGIITDYVNILSDNHIQQIGKIKKLQLDFNLSNNQLAMLFGKICNYEYEIEQSYLNWLFIDNDFSMNFKDAFTNLANEGQTSSYVNEFIFQEDGCLHPFMNYISSVLQVDAEGIAQLQFLFTKNGSNPIITRNGILNLIRATYLMPVFNLSVSELNAYLTLSGKNNLSSEALTNSFSEIPLFQRQGINFEYALYLLQNKLLGNSAITTPNDDDFTSIARKLLAIAQNPKIDGVSSSTNNVKTILINELLPLCAMDIELVTLVADNFDSSKNFKTYIDRLAHAASISIAQSDAIAKHFEGISTTLSEAQKTILKKELIELTSLSGTVIDTILVKYFTDHTLPAYLDELTGIPALKLDLLKIWCALLFVKQTAFSADILSDYFSATNKPLNIFLLPLSGGSIESFMELLWLLEAKTYLKNPAEPFKFYNSLVNTSSTKKTICDYFKWAKFITVESDFNTLLIPLGATQRIQWFIEFGKLAELSINPKDIIGWMKWNSIDKTQIMAIRTIAKDKLSIGTYNKRVALLRDNLRIKQRDALVNYVLMHTSLENSNDLFSYFLIDTQMTPAVSTSRIVQATLAIQLLIQRIQFNLEPDILLSKSDENRWKWMSLYRVWEANRKIFLYPENWLEPELRDDKSPFFKELEKELTSNEITKESVTLEYQSYLKKVEKIANVEYCQMFNEVYDNYSVLHVIGRTPLSPHEYYYRKFINESYWTAWEPLGFELNSDHILPVVIDDRLMLFWLEYSSEAKEPSNAEINSIVGSNNSINQIQAPQKTLCLQICWSENKNGLWCEKKIFPNKISIEANSNNNYISKDEIRFIFETGENNYLHVMFAYNEGIIPYGIVIPGKGDNTIPGGTMLPGKGGNTVPGGTIVPGKGDNSIPEGTIIPGKGDIAANFYEYKFEIEVYNEVMIKPIETESHKQTGVYSFLSKKIDNIYLPDGTVNYYQKVRPINEDGIISLPIATDTGISSLKQMVDATDDELISLLYPSHYLDYHCQSPFIVEKGRHSLIMVPVIQPKNESNISKQIRNVGSKLSQTFDGGIYNETKRKAPEFFTDDDVSLTMINDDNENLTFNKNTATYRSVEPEKHKTRILTFLGYHPYIGIMRRNIERYGIDGLLNPSGVNSKIGSDGVELLKARQQNESLLDDFELNSDLVLNLIKNTGNTINDNKFIKAMFEFNTKSAYGIYNWELFFHIPYMIANHFYTIGNFDEALVWIHYIFDPRETEGSYPGRFWKFKPFADYNQTNGIDDILFDTNMANGSSPESNELEDQIEIWSNDPFKPHNVARMRISAYMKATVMRYLDILVARGDQSFRVDTMESINEALQYYIIASQILGNKPEVLETSIINPKNYNAFHTGTMGNGIECLEESVIKPENAAFLEKFVESNELEVSSKQFSNEKNMKNMVQDLYSKLQETEKVFKLYFGIPKNDKMFSYWELVGDRLFKIRNSLNLDGIKRSVSLFAPPIDPGMLAAAAAAGLDITALVNGQAGPATQYRFRTMLSQALELCSEIKSLSSQLLSAYEKEDSEKIALLRANHEILLTDKVTRIKQKAIEDATIQIEQLNKQKESIEFRKTFYSTRNSRIKKEEQQLDFMERSMAYQVSSQAALILASTLVPIPKIDAGTSGVGGTPVFHVGAIDGQKLALGCQITSSTLGLLSTIASYKSNRAATIAGFDRRDEEWKFQADSANNELAPLEQQQLAAEIRKLMSTYELENHYQQLNQSKEAYEVMSTKFSNEQLYNWMRKEISELQRKAYDMAYKLAKQAEKAYDFELNPGGFSNFISSSHSDSKYGSFYSGEKLYQELKQMEISFYENNKRKYELTKHVSLALMDASEILQLRKTGTCNIYIPEILFDMDHPGHCNRRIKSVSLTIPCVTGPYTSVSAELTLGDNQFKTKEQNILQGQPLTTSMATSTAQNDSGMFELNFNDERYLPFEGAGVDSHWTISLPNNLRQFDYNTITDVIITIHYTAENGGNRPEIEDQLLTTIKAAMVGTNKNFAVMIDVKNQFPEVFEQLKTQNATVELSKNILPAFLMSATVKTSGIWRYEDDLENPTSINSSAVFGNTPISVPLIKFATSAIPANLILIVQLDLGN